MTDTGKGSARNDLLLESHQLLETGNTGAAIRKLKAHLKQVSDDVKARHLLGLAYLASKRPEDAVAAFEQVLAEGVDSLEAKLNLAVAMAAVGRVREATKLLVDLHTSDPANLAVLDNLALAHIESGDLGHALETADERIQLDDQDPEGFFQRGNVHLLSGRTSEASDDFQRAVVLDGKDPRFHYNFGFSLYQSGRQAEATKAFRKFYSLDKKSAAHYVYGNAAALFSKAKSYIASKSPVHDGRKAPLLGRSSHIEDLCELLERVGPKDVTVLIRGDSGSGKELCARALHDTSSRSSQPFVAFNVAAVPDDLLESELFGVVKGAFTGATQDQPGLFETASGGTLFLDEIAEMSPRAQAKILRALEERKVRRLGERKERAIDVRLVAATHQDLRARVDQGSFREDLYYRLKVVEIYIPPLRDRKEDIPELAHHFLRSLADSHSLDVKGIDDAAFTRLESYDWPGNVRELKNAIEHAVIMARGDTIAEEDLPAEIVPENQAKPGVGVLTGETAAEREKLLNALEQTRWHKGRAAELLGISRRHVHRLIEKHGIIG